MSDEDGKPTWFESESKEKKKEEKPNSNNDPTWFEADDTKKAKEVS